MSYFEIFIQLLGFVAFSISLASYQFKSQRTMFGYRVTSDSIWTLHYFLLGALTPALTILVAASRTYLTVFVFPAHKKLIIAIAVLCVIVLCLCYGGNDWRNYIPILTAVVYGLATYFHDSYVISRCLMALGLTLWILIGILFGSYPEIISSTLGLLSLMIGFYKHQRLTDIKLADHSRD